MRRLLLIIALFMAATAAAADNAVLASRASRAFDNREWASAFAIYTLITPDTPDAIGPYSRSIVAAWMLPDTAQIGPCVESALSHGIVLDSLLRQIEAEAFALGDAEIYKGILHTTAEALPFLRRPIDKALLSFYTTRADGPNMVKYARIMLAGRPDDIAAMQALAKGYLLAGDTSAAKTAYSDLLVASPRDYDALVALATITMPADPEAARALIRRALAIKPSPYLEGLLKDSGWK